MGVAGGEEEKLHVDFHGLHADEATELIVDAALKYGHLFDVVPCCGRPRLSPRRRTASPRHRRL